MSTKIGHFEIVSELAKSPTAVVYKANDLQSGQTVALKAIQLEAFGDAAGELEQALLAESERTKVLSSPNITNVYWAGQVDGQFCAAMEYVQGNSIATMLARKEGFSIWDLLDIGRQLCQGFEHATSHEIVHYSLEPSKIMCGWDGTVKVLSFGVSSVGNFVQHAGELSSIQYYMSPEQVRGEATDARSNLFSLGAMFYEMVTERKAFDREDMESLRQSIVESTPTAPIHVNPKVHPLLSDLIMKAIAKDPAERYQTGRELLEDLEKCKESKSVAAKKPEAPKAAPPVEKAKAAAPPREVAPPAPAKPAPPQPVAKKPAAPAVAAPAQPAAPVKAVARQAAPKAAAAAAGAGSSAVSKTAKKEVPELDLSDAYVSAPSQPVVQAVETESAHMSSAVLDEPQVETFEPQADEAPAFAVDPMMAEGGSAGSAGSSFSEISELPPLKETYTPPPPSKPQLQAEAEVPTYANVLKHGTDVEEKPKIQPREVAQKAIKEIKGVPPKLMFYSLAGAGILIVAIAIGFTLYIHGLGSDDDAGAAKRPAVVEQTPVEPQPAPKKAKAAPAPVQSQPEEEAAPVEKSATSSKSKAAARKKATTAAPPAIIPGQLAVDSVPAGALVQVDGKGDPTWVTPFAMTNVAPGQHSITISKAGYVTDTRTVDVGSGNRANTVVKLVQLMATLIVKSEPAGANIYVDGHDVGAKTPAQVSVGKGEHMVLVRMSGYLDETMNAQFVLGQTFNFSPTLKALGNADSIKTVGKMSKLFGGGKGDAGQATVSIRTTPKGAQVAINQHMLDKNSPVDVLVDPGNYEVDITLTGYARVHKVITADKKGKIVIDEVLQPQ
jgi:serine/threonine-protein kinase